MSILAKTLKHYLQHKGVSIASELSGLHHVEQLILDWGKERVGDFLTNMTTEVHWHNRYSLTDDELATWNREREHIRQKFGI